MADEVSTGAPSAPATPTTTTPASPASTAAPATTTPAADVKKPASFKAALFAAEKAGSSAATDPDIASTEPAAATVLPTDAGSSAERGPVPYERFSQQNKRLKEIEAENAVYAWAKGLDKQTVHDTVQWRAKSQTDLPGFLRELIETAPADKLAQLRSELARQLSTKPAASDQEPAPDLQTDTGQPVYSAKQLAAWQDWRDAKSQAAFDQRLAPIQAELNRGKDERAKVESKAKAQSFASSTMQDAAKWPGFTENVQAIAAKYAAMPVGTSEAEERLAMQTAYLDVLATTIFPTYDKTAEDRAIATMQTKAAAGSAHPGRATTAPNPNKPKSLGESLRREAEKAGWR